MMVGPVFVVLIIHRQLQDDKNRSDLKYGMIQNNVDFCCSFYTTHSNAYKIT